MRIATWNVNSLRVRLPQVLAWLAEAQPDVLGLQETKVPDDQFPRQEIEEAGYHAVFTGQRGYNGVALLSRFPPAEVVTDGVGLDGEQRRFIAASFDDVRVVNLYVPNGERLDSDKYAFKLNWLEALCEHLGEQMAAYERLAVIGDFNIAPGPEDVHDPELWEGRVLYSEPERAALRGLLGLGLSDTFRLFEQGAGTFSWWDYRMNAFRRNLGLRIDHILASPALAEACRACHIDKIPRGWQRPSDHAPVLADFAA